MTSATTWRPLPCPYYDVEHQESWLQEQAANGLFLEHWGAFFARFRRAAPAAVRYRVTAARLEGGVLSSPPREPEPDQQELFAGEGWQFVAAHGEFFIYACADPAAPELHTDPAVQAISLKMAQRNERFNVCSYLIYFVLVAVQFVLRGNLWLGTFLEVPLVAAAAVFVMALCILSAFGGLITLRRLTKRLQNGYVPQHNKPWRKTAVLYHIDQLVTVGLLAMLLLFGLAPDRTPEIDTDTYGPLPFATLADVTGGPVVQDEPATLEVRGNFAAPQLLHYRESAETANGSYTLYVDYYQTAAPWMARRMAVELHTLKKKMVPEAVPVKCPAGFDAAYGYGYEGVFEQLILVRGNTVMSALWFGGDGQSAIEQFLPVFAEKLQ